MLQSFKIRRAAQLFVATLFLSLAAVAHAQESPEGRWVAEHPSDGGIGSWWDFRADGTFAVYQGAMVTSPIAHSSNVITLPPTTAGGAPNHIRFHVEGDILRLTSAAGAEVTYSRVGAAPSATDPLLGKWKPVPPKTPSSDPKTAAMEKANANALYVFGADGTESVRIPFSARRGTWDAKSQTFKFQNDPGTYKYHLAYGKLELGQPPDGKKTDTYLPDPLL
jgi:hypothetical protein